jgi:hypothetical protein
MSKFSVSTLLSYPAHVWARVYHFLTKRNEKAVAEWSASLRYKRRYTDPEDAKRFRRTE